jgi:hypothetical protein
MIYVPASRTFAVHMDKIKGGKVKAWWYSPRTGKAESAGIHPASGTHSFTPPDEGENIDWVLVLDDETASFPPPGTVAKERK